MLVMTLVLNLHLIYFRMWALVVQQISKRMPTLRHLITKPCLLILMNEVCGTYRKIRVSASVTLYGIDIMAGYHLSATALTC